MRILGLVSETHDTGLALLDNGVPMLVIEEERLTRVKHTLDFPVQAMEVAFGPPGSRPEGIDAITTPWNVARLRRSILLAILKGLPGSLNLLRQSAHPIQDVDIIFLNRYLQKGLRQHFGTAPLPDIVNVGHHDSHAAIFFVSPFEEASVLVMDGYGDDAATSTYTGRGNRLQRHWHGEIFDSIGILYTLVTCHLGFQPLEEGTVMALAACGDTTLVERMRDLVRLEPDGRFRLNMDYLSHDRYGILRPFKPRFIETFGAPRRRDEPVTDHHRALARALQTVTEETILHVVRALAKAGPSRNLVLTGGVALNCVANARILRDTDFERVWVPPCASDTGAPLGSALWHWHQTLEKPRRGFELTHAFHGPAYSDADIVAALESNGMRFERMEEGALLKRVAADLAQDRIVGWYQGRFEMGPRALGNRSILASPLKPEIKDIINARVKYREPFRPFAPAVLEERAAEWFEVGQPDPFMTLAPRVHADKRARIPAAVHVDGTARIQTVSRGANPRYYGVIEEFGRLTGVPILLNTSFNKQEPIVARPEEAISCFLRTAIDVLVLGDYYTTDRPAAAVARAREQFQVLDVNLRGGD